MLKLDNDDFLYKFDYLRSRVPDHPILERLRSGNSALNSVYLINALDELPPVVKVADAVKSAPAKDMPGVISQLEIQQRFLRQSRAELSNRFPTCTTDAERARISREILKINDEMKGITDRLEAYKRSETLPELPKNDKYPVPPDLRLCERKNHTLRSQIGRMEKELEILLRNGDAARIEAKETKLRHLKIHRSYVQREIERLKIIQS